MNQLNIFLYSKSISKKHAKCKYDTRIHPLCRDGGLTTILLNNFSFVLTFRFPVCQSISKRYNESDIDNIPPLMSFSRFLSAVQSPVLIF